jgi:solute:Na+ symporter, SSS family
MLFSLDTSLIQAVAEAEFGLINYCVLAVYLLLMVGIGAWCSKRNKSTDDFFRGGQRIPWWAAGFSIFATMLSSITFMAVPAMAYGDDWYLFLANSYILITPIVIFVFLPFYRRLNITSAYEYLEKRFNLATRMVASGLFVFFQTGRIAIVLYLPALALSTVSNFDLNSSILVMGVLCIIYTMMGGIEAVIWTDVVQTLVLLGGAIFSLVLIFSRLDISAAEMVRIGMENQKFFENTDWSWNLMTGTAWTILLGSLFHNMFAYTASQDVVQRYITTKDEKTAAKAIWLNALISVPAQAIFFAIGTALFIFYKFNPEKLLDGISNDAIFPFFVVYEMPVGVAGLIVAGLFAAAQSSASSSMNSVATALVTDFHKRLRPDSSEKTNLLLARMLTLLTGAIGVAAALAVAAADLRSALEAYLNIIGLFGGTISGLFILGLVFKKANGTGAVIGSLISAIVVFLIRDYVHFYAYAFVGIFTTVTVGLVSSFLVGKPNGRKLEGLTIRR